VPPEGFRVCLGHGLAVDHFAILPREAYEVAVDQVQHTFHLGNGYRHGHGVPREAPFHHAHRTVVICARTVHFVYENDPRDVEPVGLTPHGLGLRFNASHPVHHDHGPIKHPHGPFNFNGEVHVSGGIDHLKDVVFPGASGNGRADRDAMGALFGHEIHGRCAIMHFADFVRVSGIKQDSFGEGRLPGVDVCRDTDIADQLKGEGGFGGLFGHGGSYWRLGSVGRTL